MALTSNGHMIGQAAAAERRDFRMALAEDEERRADELFDAFTDARDELRELDPTGWSQWYDEFVPDWKGWINCGEAVKVIQDRVAELKNKESHGTNEKQIKAKD